MVEIVLRLVIEPEFVNLVVMLGVFHLEGKLLQSQVRQAVLV